MADATITSKGQVTIPKEIRDRSGLEQGDRVEFRIDDEGRIVMEPLRPSRPLPAAGRLRKYAKGRPVTVEEMNEAVARSAVRRFERSTRR